ncbi:hypothetical protein OAK04_02855 [Verrucomicrobia bacterium]|nr:hypothetical protein [Verrucomicrobiota bacterium]
MNPARLLRTFQSGFTYLSESKLRTASEETVVAEGLVSARACPGEGNWV